MKIAPLSHLSPSEIELYGGQPNKQSADMLSTYDQGRMIWHGYTGAAGWMLRQAMEGVVGAQLVNNQVVMPPDIKLDTRHFVSDRPDPQRLREPAHPQKRAERLFYRKTGKSNVYCLIF
jgi:hypothetical protein